MTERWDTLDNGRRKREKDTRGGGIGCRALRLLREDSLAGMQILAGTPPRVWAFSWYLLCKGKQCDKAELVVTGTFEFFWPMPVGGPAYLPAIAGALAAVNATFVPIYAAGINAEFFAANPGFAREIGDLRRIDRRQGGSMLTIWKPCFWKRRGAFEHPWLRAAVPCRWRKTLPRTAGLRQFDVASSRVRQPLLGDGGRPAVRVLRRGPHKPFQVLFQFSGGLAYTGRPCLSGG